MEDELIPIGKIIKCQGIKGQIRFYPDYTDLELADYNGKIYTIDSSGIALLRETTSIRSHKNFWIIHFKGIDSINEAKNLLGQKIAVKKNFFIQLPPGNYYCFDIIGLDIYDEQNNFYGKISEIFPTGSNDVYVVKGAQKEDLFLPATKEIIKKIDLKEKKVIIHLVEGLF